MDKYIIACSKKWFLKNNKSLSKKFIIISKKSDLNLKFISKISPKYIFFPHWSFIVPSKILNKYNCICFHTSNLPFGRGGSPIQNLIKRKIYSTYVCAFKMTEILDGGPIYYKKKILLKTSLENIFTNISKKITEMIFLIIEKNPKPKNQTGRVYSFKRLTPKESKLNTERGISDIYDKIRMLDSDEYPRAYIKKGKYLFYFKKAIKIKNKITCQVMIENIKKN